MKTRTMFDYEMLFGDHMGKVSHQAKLYYIKLNFYAHNGFVSNPMEVLDSLGFDKGVFMELVNNEELLTLPNRSEVFITSYFVHNRFKFDIWKASPFYQYWKGKLFIKKNGVATFKPQGDDGEDSIVADDTPKSQEEKYSKDDWDKLFPDDSKTPELPGIEITDEDLPF